MNRGRGRPRRPGPVTRAAVFASAVAVGLALGVGIDIWRVGGLQAWLARGAGSPAGPAYERLGRLVQVDGRAVYLDCRGAGSPTIILEAGLGSDAAGWGEVLDGLVTVTRTCAWERPGLGGSTPRGVHTGMDTAGDLRAALAEAGERGPYIVVAHSFGGVYARLFAATEGDPVAALVMMDTYDPDLGMEADPTLDRAFRDEIKRALDETGVTIEGVEGLDWEATLAELQAAAGARPRTLALSTDPHLRYQDPDPVRRAAMVAGWHRAWAALYPGGELEIVPNVGHFIHLDRPDLVVARVRAIVLEVRAAPSASPMGITSRPRRAAPSCSRAGRTRTCTPRA